MIRAPIPDIAILIPTRGRPARLAETVDSILATAAKPETLQIVVRISTEDPGRSGYFDQRYDGADVWNVANCARYGEGIEFLRQRTGARILFCGSDDVLFRTPGWDDAVREAFAAVPDGLLVAYANNGQDREKCEHFFTTQRWVDTVGYLLWKQFEHFCVDQWVEELATSIGRLQFLREVVVEHMHAKYKKAVRDETYAMVRNNGTSERDNALFATLGPERAKAVAKLQAAMR